MDCGLFTTSYQEDMAVLFAPAAKAKVAAIIVFFLVLPYFVSPYFISVVNLIAIAVIGALGLNILTGFTGQISIGHGAFMGVGAYTVGILTTKVGLSYWAALPLAGIMAAMVGAVFGIPSLRLKGLYLAIATLAAQVIIEYTIIHWTGLTNGSAGIVIDAPSVGTMSLADDKNFYYFALLIALAAVVCTVNLFRSRVGRAFMAVRDRDLAAAVMGINLLQYKVMSFGLSAFYAGIAGALMAGYLRVITVENFTVEVSIQYLAMIIIGGLGSVMGSIYGAAFMTLLPIFLRTAADFLGAFLPNVAHFLLSMQTALFGLIIVLFLVFEPEGLAKLWKDIKDYFRLWPFSY
ncbi:MAG: branched-chain amino acid ABC transporter permease [Ammonifex sp.]|jgi:branched-chain amino acid transport system permease protein|nr:MAG: branched-chain amino acid ABC transporter permease [Ammonifex sp.]